MRRLILASFLLGIPAIGHAQDDPALFKSDAAQYVKMGVVIGAARQCGLRSLDWGADAEQAIGDQFDGFANNLWGNLSDPAAQKAESDAQLALNEAENAGQTYGPSQCSHLNNGGALYELDNLILEDSNISDAQSVVPSN